MKATMTRRQAGLALAAAEVSLGQEASRRMANPRLFTFVAGKTGPWRVTKIATVAGDPLAAAERLDVVHGEVAVLPRDAAWALRGVTSNARYTNSSEKASLVARQAALGRPEAARAALIPIRKTTAWWDLPQDERRRIFEESSHHTQIGLKYLPAIARRLHHCRDLGVEEPFDFLTWFDYAPEHTTAFEDLVAALRASEEWKFVEREIDIRLAR